MSAHYLLELRLINMLDWLTTFDFWIFSSSFMRNALYASIALSIVTGIVGVLVVTNRTVFIAGSIAHGSYFGLGLAVLLNFNPEITSFVVALLIALLIYFFMRNVSYPPDVVLAIMWAGGMALGVLMIDFANSLGVMVGGELMNYLFGSIILATNTDIMLLSGFSVVLVTYMALRYKEVIMVSLDKDYAKSIGINSELYRFTFILFTAVATMFSIKLVGMTLVIALLAIPSYIAISMSRNLITSMVVAMAMVFGACFLGLVISYYLNTTPGATIVSLLILFALIHRLFSKSF